MMERHGMSIKSEFEKWSAHLRRLNLPVAKMLLPGLETNYVYRQISDLGLDCSHDLIELYSVCGGVGAPADELLNHMWMYGSYYMLPFERAVDDYKLFCVDSRWNQAWFPIFGNDGGDFYSSCSISSEDTWNKISYFTLGGGDIPRILYSSLENMLVVINECFDKGICFADKEGNLRTKFFEASLIAMEHNKDLPYYQ